MAWESRVKRTGREAIGSVLLEGAARLRELHLLRNVDSERVERRDEVTVSVIGSAAVQQAASAIAGKFEASRAETRTSPKGYDNLLVTYYCSLSGNSPSLFYKLALWV